MDRARAVYMQALRTHMRALEVATNCARQRARRSTRTRTSTELAQKPAGTRTMAPSKPNGANVLTPRQAEVATLIARGLTNLEIAEALVITTGTTANHVAAILDRLGATNRVQVAAWVTAREPRTPDGTAHEG